MSGVLCVYRAERFSPNSVDRDRAVMDAVASLLAGRGIAVKTVGEELNFGGLLGNGPVMEVNRYSPAKFIHRGGRIPAPMQSLKN